MGRERAARRTVTLRRLKQVGCDALALGLLALALLALALLALALPLSLSHSPSPCAWSKCIAPSMACCAGRCDGRARRRRVSHSLLSLCTKLLARSICARSHAGRGRPRSLPSTNHQPLLPTCGSKGACEQLLQSSCSNLASQIKLLKSRCSSDETLI